MTCFFAIQFALRQAIDMHLQNVIGLKHQFYFNCFFLPQSEEQYEQKKVV